MDNNLKQDDSKVTIMVEFFMLVLQAIIILSWFTVPEAVHALKLGVHAGLAISVIVVDVASAIGYVILLIVTGHIHDDNPGFYDF